MCYFLELLVKASFETVYKVCFFSLTATCGPPDEAEQQGGADKGPAPHMDILYRGHAQKDEDEGFTDAAPHLQEVLDAGVAALRHVRLHVLLHCHSTGHNTATKARKNRYRPDKMLPNVHIRLYTYAMIPER